MAVLRGAFLLLTVGATAIYGCTDASGSGGSAGAGGSGGTDLCALVDCHDGSPCTDDFCDPNAPEVCVFINRPEGENCYPESYHPSDFCDDSGECIVCYNYGECTETLYDPTEPSKCRYESLPAGTLCGDGQGVCDDAATCSYCRSENSCVESYYDPVLEACAYDNREPGTSCDCGPGPCKTCDGFGSCICTEDEQCASECAVGQTCSVATGVCEGGEPLPIYTPCAGPRFCDGAGSCIECFSDTNCVGDLNDCTDESCNLDTGMCHDSTPLPDGTPCAGGLCQSGACALSGSVLPCTEQGIRNAFFAGGGPYTFDCDGPQTVIFGQEIFSETDVVLDGEGKLTIDGNGLRRIFYVYASTVVFRGLRVTGATFVGIESDAALTLEDVTVSHNDGMGIWTGGRLTMVNSTVSENSGVGILNSYLLTIRNSTISNNEGHGIDMPTGRLELTESTVTGNHGDGVFCGGRFTITNSTVSTNLHNGISHDAVTTPNYLTHSTVAGNQEQALVTSRGSLLIANSLIEGDCEGRSYITSGGHNIESPADSCGFSQASDRVDVDAGELELGPLTDNGGPTQTHAVGAGSIAVDRIPEASCIDPYRDPITKDQRGVARPQNGLCDVGAFELEQGEP